MPGAEPVCEARTVRQARAEYFERNGFGENGGYDKSWVHLIDLGPIPIGIPNTPGRVAAVRFHDLHHIATGYATDPRGEAEIGAFELGAGCGRYTAAWILNMIALGTGILRWPSAVLAAYARGKACSSLYGRPFDEALLELHVSELRAQLGTDRDAPAPRTRDLVELAGFGAAGGLLAVLVFIGPVALVLALLVALARTACG